MLERVLVRLNQENQVDLDNLRIGSMVVPGVSASQAPLVVGKGDSRVARSFLET